MVDEYIYQIPQVAGGRANPPTAEDRPLPSLQKKASKNNNYMSNNPPPQRQMQRKPQHKPVEQNYVAHKAPK